MHGRVAFVLGTRPEAIKLAPVILAARRTRSLSPWLVSTGQQSDLLGPALSAFDLVPDVELDVMRAGQSVAALTSRCLAAVAEVFDCEPKPKCVVVQGDTASALAGALAGFYAKVPVAHVEAGLRSSDLSAPFPEEANRQMISRIARLHFAPTRAARSNLLAEAIAAESIFVTGNTVVDAIELLADRIDATEPPVLLPPRARLVLVTAHRRENLGRPLESICRAVCDLADERPDLHFAFVMHPNPAAARTAKQLAGRERITLLPPLPYLTTLRLLSDAWLALTDSGGLQEEAPSFRCPVLVLRETTERMEGIESRAARLVGTEADRIVLEVRRLADSANEYAQLRAKTNPYGDGQAAGRIIRCIRRLIDATSLATQAA